MFTTTLALINSTYQGRDRGVAFGVWGAVNGVAAAGGPVLGGLLTEHVGWRSIFLVNLPVSAVAIALTLACVGTSRGMPGARPDVTGMCAFTVCAGGLTYGLIRAGGDGFGAAPCPTRTPWPVPRAVAAPRMSPPWVPRSPRALTRCTRSRPPSAWREGSSSWPWSALPAASRTPNRPARPLRPDVQVGRCGR